MLLHEVSGPDRTKSEEREKRESPPFAATDGALDLLSGLSDVGCDGRFTFLCFCPLYGALIFFSCRVDTPR